MSKEPTLIFSLFSSDDIASNIAKACGFDKIDVICHPFPDGETYLKYDMPLDGRKVIIVDTLDHPNDKILPLIFAAETARDLGATDVGLVAPYLSYMRQDTRFHAGEAITSRTFARLISQAFDWMITIDPHLHRYHTLDEIYTMPTKVISAAPLLADWIEKKVPLPILIGPDSESQQWVSHIAQHINCPFTILEKERLSAHEVQVSIPNVDQYMSHTPVLVDDIVSTGQTMIETIQHLKKLGTKPPFCIIVHPIFAGITTDTFIQAGAQRVISCNTIFHDSNDPDLDVSQLLIAAIARS